MKLKFILTIYSAKTYILVIGIAITLISCSKEKKSTVENNNNSSNTQPKDESLGGPVKEVIEKEVINIVNKISAEDFKYNASIFLNQDGVFKNLAITNVEIISRESIKNIENIDQQTIQIKLIGIMDKFSLGGGLPPSLVFKERGNFVVNKEFVFKKKNNNWLGYINDNARDRISLKFKKILMR